MGMAFTHTGMIIYNSIERKEQREKTTELNKVESGACSTWASSLLSNF
jgi:hypothetical protein